MRIFNKKIIATASILAAITIAFGAFGAHGLKNLVDSNALGIFETGVRYQMYHVFALLIIGFAPGIPIKLGKRVFWFFIFGIVFFSGSLYMLSLAEILPFDVEFLGPITPFGGLLFIIGWLQLGYGFLLEKQG